MGHQHASMNRHFRLIWDAARGSWIAVHELSRGRSKGGGTGRGGSCLFAALRSLPVALALGFAGAAVAQAGPPAAAALPQGGTVVAGQASIAQSGAAMTITQASQRAAIDWQSFNLGSAASVDFKQPGASSVMLNRVHDGNASQIFGRISSNGQVFLSNPAGIYFSPTAQANVGALTATTHSISTADFMAGRSTFSRNGATGSVVNAGELTASLGGYIALLAPEVRNEGVLIAQAGTVALAAGEAMELKFSGNQLTGLVVAPSAIAALVDNQHAVLAPGGIVILSAQAAQELQGGVIKNNGNVSAGSLTERGGRILLEAGSVFHGGTLDASGLPQGGSVQVNAAQVALLDGAVRAEGQLGGSIGVSTERLGQSALVSADGAQAGGQITLQAQQVQQTQGTTLSARSALGQGGNIQLKGSGTDSRLFSSATVDVRGATGGKVQLTASQIDLYAAQLDASGRWGGGQVLIGGDFQGRNAAVPNALNTTLNAFTRVKADATEQGQGGRVIVWSDQHTAYSGSISAQGGAAGGNGGFIEVSGKATLGFNGSASAAAPQGERGTLLLDPKNITIDNASGGGVSYIPLANPNPAANGQHGTAATELSNGNIVVVSSSDSFAAASAGAVFLYDGSTGALISALRGSTANDQVGASGITALGSGNYVVRSLHWDNGSATNAGAVTWGSGSTGISGVVSASNSLVGSTANDQVGSNGITALSNGNYVLISATWDNGSATDAGAVTWGSGSTGISGVVSASNSLVGSTSGDNVGAEGIIVLSNGNYVVRSLSWDNGSATGAGAVTWGSGSTGISGVVSASNSLVGSTALDQVGNTGITALSNGSYLVSSGSWDNGSATNVGAVTWGSGSAGISGVVSASNSLVGSSAGDALGNAGITVLSNGNYVVSSSAWDNGSATGAGAVTWGSGSTGISGVVSASNSLVGSTAGDNVGANGIIALSNGNYVVRTPNWDNGSATNAGAVTWGSGSTGISGVVSASNSLVGSRANDQVGVNGITALSNGNYVVISATWGNGSATGAGAVTWGNGSTGTSGVVSASNSLVGSTANDRVGSNGITALSNGNYVVRSLLWDNGSVTNAGAVTWGSGSTGISGVVSASNSLVGSTAQDQVGASGITALSNGSYVVSSGAWDNGSAAQAGAVTWGSGSTGISGVVSASNSLVGSTANDQVGSNGITALSNGNYVVRSPNWDNGSVTNAGAVTWGSGSTGISGVVSASNSLVGSSGSDQVGGAITALSNGNYVVRSSFWDNGSTTDAGAVTWGNGSTGTSGVVSASNSLVGSTTGDEVGQGGIIALSNGNYVVRSSGWDNGSATNAGAVTWGNGSTGTSGVVSASNSLVGSSANDQVGNSGITALSNGNYVLISATWDNGSATDAGAVTWGNGSTGTSGVVSASNSLVGSTASDQVGSNGITALSNGNYVVRSSGWDNGSAINAGAVTWGSGSTGISGVVSASNSLVGSTTGDLVGAESVTALSNGNYVVRSPNWDNGSVANTGAVTWGSGTGGVTGAVSASNSLVGLATGDLTGATAVVTRANGWYVLTASTYDLGGLVNSGAIWLAGPGGSGADPVSSATFASTPGASSTISPASVKAILDAGTNVVLQANNDITLAAALSVDNPGGNGGALMLQAGRSVNLNASISTDNGNLTVIANDPNAIAAQRDAGVGTITIGAGVTLDLGTGTAVLSGQRFVNNSGAGAIATTGGGSWQVWSSSPLDDTRGGLVANFKQYDATFGSSSVLGTGNGLLYTLAPTITASLTGSVQRDYDTTNVASLGAGNFSQSGAVDGDTVLLTTPSSGSFDSKNVGTAKTVTATGLAVASASNGATTVYGYQLASATASAAIGSINAVALNVDGLSASNKVYDATTTASLSGTASVTALGSDVVSLGGTATGTFANKNVGNNKAVTISGLSLGGADAGNYLLVAPGSLTASITPANLAVAGLSASHKVYDTTTAASLSGSASVAALGNDVVSLAGTATGAFANKNVGNNKAVTVSGLSLSGADAGNYVLVSPGSLAASITPASLVVSGLSAANKVYDTTTTASLSGTATVAALGSDVVSLSGTAAGSFANKNAGSGKAVTVSGLSLGGTDAGNYTLSTPTLTANISRADVSLGGIGVADRAYTAGTTATLTGSASVAALGSDSLSVGQGSASFADANAGVGKAVTLRGFTLGGADADNYNLLVPTNLTATITPAPLTITANDDSKFVGQADANGFNGAQYSGFVGGEDASALSGTLTVTRSNASSNAAGSYTGVLVPSGLSSSNYAISFANGNFNVLAAQELLVKVNNSTSIYGGTPTFSIGSVAYLSGSNVVTPLTLSSASGNTYTYDDGVGGTVTFTLGASGALSTAGALRVGNYAVGANGISTTGSNFTGTPTLQGVLTVAPKSLTASATTVTKVYDATTSMGSLGLSLAGGLSNDLLSVSGSGTYASANAGTGLSYTLSGLQLGGADQGNYVLASTASGTNGVITPRAVGASGVTAVNRVYNTSLTVAVGGTGTVEALAGDTLTLAGTGVGTMADKHAGTAKAVTVSGLTLGGASAANYTLTQPTGLTVDISPASLTVTGLTANDKVYDATPAATLGGTGTVTALGGDVVTVSGGTGVFANKNAGTGKAVTVTGIVLGGVDAGNYTVQAPGDLTASITRANLALGGLSAGNKVYDATPVASIAGTASVSALGSDTVSVAGSAVGSFANKNVGVGKAVSVTGLSLTGADSLNYNLVVSPLAASITAANLNVNGLSAASKVYDATTSATLTGSASVTALGSDVVSLSGSAAGAFANKNVGTAKAIVISGLTLSGADAANYMLVAPGSLSADVTPAALNVTGLTADNKVYDATTTASLSGTASVAALGSDVVTVSGGSASFASKNVDNNKAVTVTGIVLGGADAGNYTVVMPTGLSANITPANLTVGGLTADNKVYDATTTATLSGTASVTALGADVVTVSGGTGSFADKNVGNSKAVAVSGLSLGGADAANYVLVAPSGLTANITPALLAVGGLSANSKVYDTTTAASLTGTASVTALDDDDVTVSGGTGSFADKNVGNNKAVTVNGLSLGGADAGNYTLVAPTDLSASITPASLAVGGLSASNKVYNATTTATLSGTASVTALGSDVVTVGGGTGSFADKNVGNNKAVSVNGLSLGGADAANYVIVAPSSLTASITPASLAVGGLSASNKVYDATTTATLSGTASVTALGSDVVTVSGGTGSFADKNVGNNKAVTVNGLSLGGADAGNYTLVAPTDLSASITTASLAVGGLSANSKVYDTTTAASLTGTASVMALGSDVVTVSGGTGSFADKNVGNNKAVTVNGLSLGGADAGNYTPVAPTDLSASITTAWLAVGGLSASNKVYNATTTATLSGTASVTALGSDVVTVSGGTGSFADKNVGNSKAVAVSGLSLGGADAANYVLVAPNGLTANITPALLAVGGLSANSKVYDTTTAASLTGTASVTALGSDVVTVSGGTGSFADKNVGNNKAVAVNGLSLGGADAGNYTLVAPTDLSASITPASLAVGGLSASNKVYNATTTATLSGTASVTALGNDVVTVSGGTGSFADKNVGNNKAVAVHGLRLGGADAANYVIVAPSSLTASITPASLAYVADAKSFASGGMLPALTGSVSGFVGDESQATATQGQLQFSTTATNTSPQGDYAVTGAGLTAQNYVFTQAAGNAAALTVKPPAVAVVPPSVPPVAPPAPAAPPALNMASTGPALLVMAQAAPAPAETQVAPSSAPAAGSSRTISVTTAPQLGTGAAPMLAVSVPTEIAQAGAGFAFALPADMLPALLAPNANTQATLAGGAPLPSWLSFDKQTGRIVATQVPPGGLPVQVLLSGAGTNVVVNIAERQ